MSTKAEGLNVTRILNGGQPELRIGRHVKLTKKQAGLSTRRALPVFDILLHPVGTPVAHFCYTVYLDSDAFDLTNPEKKE